MSQVMISLVSEQRMQNVIPVFQRGSHFERLWLVRSTEADTPASRFAQAWKDTTNTLREALDIQSAEPPVGAYGIEQTRDLVSALIKKEAQGRVVVNFTGGTKCMSIGAYLAAQSAYVDSLYVDTASEKLVWFYPDGKVREEDFDLADRLTVPIYLRANGKQIDEERTRQHHLPDSAYAVARALAGLWPRCADALEVFGKAISQGQTTVGGVDDEIDQMLAGYRLIQPSRQGWQVAQQARGFLTGKWLDAMVYVLLEDSRFFDDVKSEVCLQGVKNELDVLATRRAQLAIIECKSGDLGGQTTLNKLQAIRSGFGTFARAFFVTSRRADQVDQPFRDRAREYGVREIITSESLLHMADIVREKMRGVP